MIINYYFFPVIIFQNYLLLICRDSRLLSSKFFK